VSVVSKVVATVVAAAVAVQAANPVALARAPDPTDTRGTLSRADYEACQSGDEATFRAAIEGITLAALRRALATFDYGSAVTDAWRGRGMDGTIDRQVDAAVADVGKETSWAALLQSLGDSKKAEELATAVAERVYRSDAVKAGIEALTGDVARTLSTSLELATGDATEPALQCLRAFLGPRYGTMVARSVTSSAETTLGADGGAGTATISTGAVVAQTSGGITGAALILMRRQLANLAARVGQRVVGSVLARLVSVVAGGIGAILIAKDIWELRTGVLPIIATEMKATATKDLVRAELAKTIAEQIGEQIKDVAARSADRVVEVWHEFRAAHAKVLEIAARVPRFRDFLDTTTPRNLPRLDEVVALLLPSEGEAGVLTRLTDGSLDRAVNKLPPEGMAIARETRSLQTGLAWATVAGDLLPQVAQYELHTRMDVAQVTRPMLTRLFALGDKLAVTRLASLPRDARQTLFELDPTRLTALARSLSEDELGALAGYLTGLEAKARARVLAAVAGTPGKMRVLAAARVREAVLQSRDQTQAVEMMLREGPGSASEITADFRGVVDGAISPWLLVERHPLLLALSVVPLLVLLLLLKRLVSSPRRRTA
jgi:hypothetical protein